MRFGLFIPQGWRLDLVGIDPDDADLTIDYVHANVYDAADALGMERFDIVYTG